jgi:hypothetical protein
MYEKEERTALTYSYSKGMKEQELSWEENQSNSSSLNSWMNVCVRSAAEPTF